MLINGERFSGKSTDIFTELRRISAANVARIEIVDGATLNVPAWPARSPTSSPVGRGLSGNFVWRPQQRARRTPFRWSNGEVSLNGPLGAAEFTLSLRNDSFRNGNAGPGWSSPPAAISSTARRGAERERRPAAPLAAPCAASSATVDPQPQRRRRPLPQDVEEVSLRSAGPARSGPQRPGARCGAGITSSAATMISARRRPAQADRPHRFTHIAVPPDPRSRPSPTARPTTASASPRTATRDDRPRRISLGSAAAPTGRSRRGRAQQLDVENACSSSTRPATSCRCPFPTRPATVQEKAREALLTYGRPLSPTLTLQASVGGEYSQLSQEGAGGLTRTFYRPKGFASLAWRRAAASTSARRIERRRPAQLLRLRRLGQCQRRHLQCRQRQSGAAAELERPGPGDPQPRPWGTATARLYGRLITDVVDIIPIGANGQSPGNLDGTATVFGLQWTSTFNFDPIGWRGAKLDLNLSSRRRSPSESADRAYPGRSTRT